MHSVRFNIELKNSLNIDDIENRIDKNPLVSKTKTFDSNIIFELGRRYGFAGRLYSHCIINENNLLFEDNNCTIKGWAFVPQEGNTLISTLHAFLLQMRQTNSEKKIAKIQTELI
jgi:glyceraldehyde-3-phosphate dehydrogenase (NAD(P))